MKLAIGYVLKAKIAAHIFQALFIFIAWCMTIAILRAPGTTDGRTKWYFAVCWLSLPTLIYLSMTPQWSRTVKFVNAYAFAALDILFAIFWFSAFIAVAVWNAVGQDKGMNDNKLPDANCTTFAFGPASKCSLSKATVGFGFVIFISFCLTSAISVHGLMHYRKNGSLPGITPSSSDPSSIEAQTKDAFSTNPHDDTYDDDGTHTERGGDQEEDEYALLHSTESDEGRHPGRPVSWGPSGQEGYDTSYTGAYESRRPARVPSADPFGDDVGRRQSVGPPAYSTGGVEDAAFPNANYGYRSTSRT